MPNSCWFQRELGAFQLPMDAQDLLEIRSSAAWLPSGPTLGQKPAGSNRGWASQTLLSLSLDQVPCRGCLTRADRQDVPQQMCNGCKWERGRIRTQNASLPGSGWGCVFYPSRGECCNCQLISEPIQNQIHLAKRLDVRQ